MKLLSYSQPQDSAAWQGDTLRATCWYEYPQLHSQEYELRRVALMDTSADYFCAVDGECYALSAVSKSTCIATVECMLSLAGCHANYVTFAPRNRTESTVRAWVKKWSKRTGDVSPWEATVRACAQAA